MIPVEQVEQLISQQVLPLREALSQMREAGAQMREALAQATRTIAMLQTKLYGVRAETSQVVLTAEGQQFIDATWGMSQETTPAPATPE